MISHHKITEYQEHLFTLSIYATYFLIAAAYLGISTAAPKYLNDLNFYVKIYVCLFLLLRFNPFRKMDSFTTLDRKIAFSAGIIIFTTTILDSYILEMKDTIVAFFKK